jgi:hypothetical protein
MARTIWKYPLIHTSLPQEIKVPVGADLLSVGEQDGDIVLWAAVDPDCEPTATRQITIVGTGKTIPDGILRFIGTVQKQSGTVYHIFEG